MNSDRNGHDRAKIELSNSLGVLRTVSGVDRDGDRDVRWDFMETRLEMQAARLPSSFYAQEFGLHSQQMGHQCRRKEK